MATLSTVGAILDVFYAAMRTYIRDMAQRRLASLSPIILLIGSLAAWSCSRAPSNAGHGEAWVSVNEVPIGASELQGVRQELAEYGRVRFSNDQAKNALLASMIKLELLATKAKDAGFFEDPRVQWSVVDTLAQKQARAIKERRVPRAKVQADTAALQDFVNQKPGSFVGPEKRRAWIAVTKSWSQAQALIDSLQSKIQDPKEVEHAALSEPMARDDKAYPVFHRLLFDPSLQEGEYLAGPVLVQGKPCVVRLDEILQATPVDLQDAQQRARVVDAAIVAPQKRALAERLQSLRQRWPLRRSEDSKERAPEILLNPES